MRHLAHDFSHRRKIMLDCDDDGPTPLQKTFQWKTIQFIIFVKRISDLYYPWMIKTIEKNVFWNRIKFYEQVQFDNHIYESKLLLVPSAQYLESWCTLWFFRTWQAWMLNMNRKFRMRGDIWCRCIVFGKGANWWLFLRYVWSYLQNTWRGWCIFWFLCTWQTWILNKSHRYQMLGKDKVFGTSYLIRWNILANNVPHLLKLLRLINLHKWGNCSYV